MTIVGKLDLSTSEVENGNDKELRVEWHPTMKCPVCSDKMYFETGWLRWVCRSWLYMEGGC